MRRLLLLIPLLSGCTFDCHIDCDLSLLVPKPKPKAPVAEPQYERLNAYLNAEGLAKARDHGWLVVAMVNHTHGIQYYLRRPLIAESAPMPAEKP